MSTFNFKEILDNAENENFLQPEGKKVPAVITSAAYSKSNSGNAMITIRAKVVGGPHAGKGRPLYGYIMLEVSSGVNQLFNAGIKRVMLEKFDGMDTDDFGPVIAAELVDKRVAIDIRHDKWNDRVSAKVSWVNPAQGTVGPQAPKSASVARREAEQTAASDVLKAERPAAAAEEESELARLQRELAAAQAANQDASASARRSPAPDDFPF